MDAIMLTVRWECVLCNSIFNCQLLPLLAISTSAAIWAFFVHLFIMHTAHISSVVSRHPHGSSRFLSFFWGSYTKLVCTHVPMNQRTCEKGICRQWFSFDCIVIYFVHAAVFEERSNISLNLCAYDCVYTCKDIRIAIKRILCTKKIEMCVPILYYNAQGVVDTWVIGTTQTRLAGWSVILSYTKELYRSNWS